LVKKWLASLMFDKGQLISMMNEVNIIKRKNAKLSTNLACEGEKIKAARDA
jgi:hypothetical protein